MKAAFLQYNPAFLQVEQNLARVEAMLDGVEADLVVLPELFASGYFFRDREEVTRVAETVPDGPTTQKLLEWARKFDAVFVGGLPERTGDQLFNSAVIARKEKFIGTYRKVHLFYEEKKHFAPGDVGFPVFTVRDQSGTSYRLGVMICFDWYFPEAARSLALQGADVIAHPSNLVRPDCPRSMPIRALENHVYTITANRIGTESHDGRSLTYIGQSEICDPDGHILVQAGREEACVRVVDIDPSTTRNRQITAYNDLFGDRRPDVYRLTSSTV